MLARNKYLKHVVSLLVVGWLAGCQEAPDGKSFAAQFSLTYPSESEVVVDYSGGLSGVIMGSGAINASNLRIALNGVDITSRVTITGTSAYVSMEDIKGLILLGQNTVTASTTNTGYSEDFSFSFDNVVPSIEVTSVTSTVSGNTTLVSGVLHDPSRVVSLQFKDSNGTFHDVVLDEDEPAGSQTFSVNLVYPNTSISVNTEPHFVYTVTDEHGQTRTEKLIVPGSRLASFGVGQINGSAFDHIEELANRLINPLNNILASNGYGIEQFPEDASNLGTVAQSGDDLVLPVPPAILPAGVPLYSLENCPSEIFSTQAQACIVYVRDVRMINPAFSLMYASYASMEEGNNDNPQIWADIWLESLGVDVQVVGVQADITSSTGYRMVGSFKTSMALTNFKFRNTIDIFPEPGKIIGLERNNGFKLLMTQLFQQPHMYNSSCNICVVDVGQVELAYNLRILRESGNPENSLGDMIVDLLEAKVTDVFKASIDGLLDDVSASEVQTTDGDDPLVPRQITKTQSATKTTPVTIFKPLDPYGAFFKFSGGYSVAPGYENATYDSLGSLFYPANGYYNANKEVFAGRLNNQQVDFAVALTSNTVNQYLLAKHQTGMFEEMDLTLDDTEVQQLATWFNTTSGNEVKLKIETLNAPKVKFRPYAKASPNYSFNFLGLIKYATDNQDTIPAIFFEVDNVVMTVTDTVNGDLLTAQADLDFTVLLKHNSSSYEATATLLKDSIQVNVNDVQGTPDFVSPFDVLSDSVWNAIAADAITTALESYADNNPNLLQTVTTTVDAVSALGALNYDGMTLVYSDYLTGYLPREYGVLPRWFGIEPSGAYLTIGGDIVAKTLGSNCDSGYTPTDSRYLWSMCLYR